jgi:hypothetical protein
VSIELVNGKRISLLGRSASAGAPVTNSSETERRVRSTAEYVHVNLSNAKPAQEEEVRADR